MDLSAARSCLEKHAHLYLRAYIYGSVASGKQDEYSDVDILLVQKTEKPFFQRIRDVYDLVLELGRADILIYTEHELQDMMEESGRYFIKHVVTEGVPIEGTQKRGFEMAPAGGK